MNGKCLDTILMFQINFNVTKIFSIKQSKNLIFKLVGLNFQLRKSNDYFRIVRSTARSKKKKKNHREKSLMVLKA